MPRVRPLSGICRAEIPRNGAKKPHIFKKSRMGQATTCSIVAFLFFKKT